MIPQQKRPRALDGDATAGKPNAQTSYPVRRDFQSVGEQFAGRWMDASTRFASAFFRVLTDAPIPAIAKIIDALRSENAMLSPMNFPTPAHWNLTAILCGFAERRIPPTASRVLAVAESGGFELPIGGGDALAETRAILCCESSAAGIGSWIREIRACAKKHHRARRLWRVLRDSITDSATDAAPAATPIIVTRARRRFP